MGNLKELLLRRVIWRILWRLLPDGRIASYLAFWAKLVLRAHKPVIVAITGTAGKTTTTDIVASVLKHPSALPIVGRVGQSLHNMNDDAGVPATILLLAKKTLDPVQRLKRLILVPARAIRLALSRNYPRILVLEMGTHWKGHLHQIAELAPPDVGVITTIGPGHLERLKNIDGVVQEKSAIVKRTKPSGLVVLGTDHDRVEQLRACALAPVVTVDGRGVEAAKNIARVVGRHFGIPDGAIEEALASSKLPDGRLNRIDLGFATVIDDSFNANPISMTLGLDTLAETDATSRKVAVLGPMGELGDESRRYHREVGDYARGRCDLLIGVGDAARDYQPDHWFALSSECAEAIPGLLAPGDCLLVKGSASAKMRKVVERLKEMQEPQAHDVSRAA